MGMKPVGETLWRYKTRGCTDVCSFFFCLQVANLQRLSAVPAFTWHMPQAVVPGGVVNSQQVSVVWCKPAPNPFRACSEVPVGLPVVQWYLVNCLVE